ncbi:MAG: tRNA (adenosine(37)-N6)-dimethylallyltransferase MiaA [Gemmatimonadota bacterium]
MAEAAPGGRLLDPRVLVLAGPTAAGKTELAARLAEAVGGAVVSADARQVFRGLSVGTAQPDAATRARAPHFLVGFLSPAAEYSAGLFGEDARRVLAALRARGVPTVVCGGTGLYLRALLEGAPGPGGGLPPHVDPPELRRRRRAVLAARWREEGPQALHAELAGLDPLLGARLHPIDRQRVLRALEFREEHGVPLSGVWKRPRPAAPGSGPLRFRLEVPVAELERRITVRLESMLESGWVEEARALFERFGGAGTRALDALGYPELFAVFRGERTLPEALEVTRLRTRRYAKRQRTWFRNQDGFTPVPDEGDAFERLLAAWRERLA